MLRLARVMVLLVLAHLPCLGSVMAPMVGVPIGVSLCLAAVQ
jgi:hypothetical protein